MSHSFPRLPPCPTLPGLSGAERCQHDPQGALLSQAVEIGMDTQLHSPGAPPTLGRKETSLLALSSEGAESRITWGSAGRVSPGIPSSVWNQLTFHTLCIWPGRPHNSDSLARTHPAPCLLRRLSRSLEDPHSVPVLLVFLLLAIYTLHSPPPCSVPGG